MPNVLVLMKLHLQLFKFLQENNSEKFLSDWKIVTKMNSSVLPAKKD